MTTTSPPITTSSPITPLQVYDYEGCYDGTTWESERQSDVAVDIEGLQSCRDACANANFTYFGFECPRGTSGNYVVHCECGNTLPSSSLSDDMNCRQFTSGLDPESHCTGAPDFALDDQTYGTYYLGAHNFNSAYKVVSGKFKNLN